MAIIKSLTQQVCDYIIEQIRYGKILFGDRVDENMLKEELGISRTPIREALIKLSTDGILVTIPRKGFFVREMTEQDAIEVDGITGWLEMYVIELALPKMTEDDYALMERLIDEMEISIKNQDYAIYAEKQKQFHDVYLNRTENKTLIKVYQQIQKDFIMLTWFFRNKNQLFTVLDDTNQEHRQLLEDMRNGKLENAQKLVRKHFDRLIPSL